MVLFLFHNLLKKQIKQ